MRNFLLLSCRPQHLIANNPFTILLAFLPKNHRIHATSFVLLIKWKSILKAEVVRVFFGNCVIGKYILRDDVSHSSYSCSSWNIFKHKMLRFMLLEYIFVYRKKLRRFIDEGRMKKKLDRNGCLGFVLFHFFLKAIKRNRNGRWFLKSFENLRVF